MLKNLTNHINQSSINQDVTLKVGTKWVHSGYNDSGILEKSGNEKSLNPLRIEAFISGADETRTRDLLRDRQAF